MIIATVLVWLSSPFCCLVVIVVFRFMFLLQFGFPKCCTVLSFVVILCVVVLKMHVFVVDNLEGKIV